MKKLLLIAALLVSCALAAQIESSEVINIQNPAVSDYLSDDTYYQEIGPDSTVVWRYADKEKYGPDIMFPQGKQVTWKPTAAPSDSATICITLTTYPDEYDVLTFFPSSQARSYTLYNLMPNETYYYKVEQITRDEQVQVLTDGYFRTIGQLRMLNIAGGYNIRDLGGWPTTLVPGGRLKYGILFRGAHLDNIKPSGIHDLVDNMQVGAELDFRAESKLTSSALGPDVNFAKIVTDSYSPLGEGKNYLKDFKWVLQQLNEGRFVYWHCGVGCDRCGTFSFLIEGLLGLDEVNLTRDYELSCFRGFKRGRNHIGFRRLIPWMKATYPRPTLAQSFYDYWLDMGMTPDELDTFRSIMIDGYIP